MKDETVKRSHSGLCIKAGARAHKPSVTLCILQGISIFHIEFSALKRYVSISALKCFDSFLKRRNKCICRITFHASRYDAI